MSARGRYCKDCAGIAASKALSKADQQIDGYKIHALKRRGTCGWCGKTGVELYSYTLVAYIC